MNTAEMQAPVFLTHPNAQNHTSLHTHLGVDRAERGHDSNDGLELRPHLIRELESKRSAVEVVLPHALERRDNVPAFVYQRAKASEREQAQGSCGNCFVR